MVLELMGPKAKEAVPALEQALKDEKEDVDVRIAAARALARINGADPSKLYKNIPDVEKRILDVCKEKSLVRRQAFMKREGARPVAEMTGWHAAGWWVYCLSSGQNLDAANASLKKAAEAGYMGSFMDVNSVRAFMLFHSKSSHYPGRLKPDTEAALKKYFFNHCNSSYFGRTSFTSDSLLNNREGMIRGMNHNIAMNFMTRDYLSLAILKDDPKYKDMKFKAGDTVAERFKAWNEFWKDFLKHWALNGLWMEHGSSNYEYRTPEYVIGAVTFDPNRKQAGSTGRWSGVIFRDLSAISMDAYTGEKWCVQDKDVMIAQRCTSHGYPGWPKIIFEGGFDKVEEGGWIFLDNGEAFAAVKVLRGGFWAEPIKRTFYLEDHLSPIIIQTGMLKDYGSFEAFQKAILKAPLKYADNKVEYKGPNSAKLEFFCITPEAYEAGKVKEKEYSAKLAPARREAHDKLWKEIHAKLKTEAKQVKEYHREYVSVKSTEMAEKALGIKPFSPGYTLPKINGRTIDLDMKYNYRSPYMESKAGSDIVTVRYGSRRWEYDFGKNTITEIEE